MKPTEHLPQIDILKAFAMFGIITTHTMTNDLFVKIYPYQHLGLHIYYFTLLMALSMALSFNRRGLSSLKDIYSYEYITARVRRLAIPLSIAVFLVICLDEIWAATGHQRYFMYPSASLFYELVWPGFGGHFIYVIAEFVVMFPIGYIIYKRYARITISVLFVAWALLRGIACIFRDYRGFSFEESMFNQAFAPRYITANVIAVALNITICSVLGVMPFRFEQTLVGLRWKLSPSV